MKFKVGDIVRLTNEETKNDPHMRWVDEDSIAIVLIPECESYDRVAKIMFLKHQKYQSLTGHIMFVSQCNMSKKLV